MQLLVLTMCVALVVVIDLPKQSVATPSPIVLIPGIMGTQLIVKDTLPKNNLASRFCSTNHKYKELWISPMRIVAHNICAKRELPLEYDPSDNTFHDNREVHVKVPGFGDTSSVEYLSPGLIDTFEYFHKTVEYFVDRGYKRGETIRAAPYDWRLAADELEKRGYFHQLKTLIEEMYYNNGQTKVTLVVHSMGGIISLHFLTGFSAVDQAWKDKHIHALVTLNGAWSGGAGTLQTVISGAHSMPDTLLFASRLINEFFVPIIRTFESLPWLFPKPSVFGDQVLISTPDKGYTASDYEELFRKVGYTNGYRFFKDVQGINPDYPAPNVPTYCFYGDEVKTPLKYTYSKNFDGRRSTIGWKPKITKGDGDGSLNIESSRVCHRWSSMPSEYPFRYKTFHGVEHKAIVKNREVLAEIDKIVRGSERMRFLEILLSII